MQCSSSPASPPPPPCLRLCRALSSSSRSSRPVLAFRHSLSSPSPIFLGPVYPEKQQQQQQQQQRRPLTAPRSSRRDYGANGKVEVKGRKDNVWSIDNELAEKEGQKTRQRRRKGRRPVRGKRGKDGRVMVSGAMLMEVETVLQAQEPVIKPSWNTFASSLSGIWKGVGAVFSPITAEMEPIEIGNKNESLYDCYTMSCIKAVSDPSAGAQTSQIHRKINWATFNPYGEILQQHGGNDSKVYKNGGGAFLSEKGRTKNEGVANPSLPKFDSFDFETSDVLEEDVMGNEPGLVFFEDGSYSRGPADIPVGEIDDSKYYLMPTFKFEQCLVKGCHKRLRMVHTIEFNNGGVDIQIMRVAVYEEEWICPSNLRDESNLEFNMETFSQRKRTQPSDLIGSWKVFEVSATPIYGEYETLMEEQADRTPYVYFCTETLKNRSLPENLVYFGEGEMLDTKDVTILWLPGGVTAYVDINREGILCIGVGWYSEEGMNLVMERDYGLDGKLKEVRWKTEVKRRSSSNPM